MFLHLFGASEVAHRQEVAAKGGVDLDLHLRPGALAVEFHLHSFRALWRLGDTGPRQAPLDLGPYARQGFADCIERLRPVMDGKIGEVDIDRQAGQIPFEEIDGCAALESEDRLSHHQWQDIEQ